MRPTAEWQSLVITLASKLCMGQQRLAEADPADSTDPIRFLGQSLPWDCCGLYNTNPRWAG